LVAAEMSVVRYLGELGAGLLVAVRQGDDVVQVSDDRERLLVAHPREADAAGPDRRARRRALAFSRLPMSTESGETCCVQARSRSTSSASELLSAA
jgi:hypothetical protein